jgi:Meiotically up-regulated gene 113
MLCASTDGRAENVGHLYIRRSGDTNLFKFGVTNDVPRRGRELATGNPDKLTLFDTIESENHTQCETFLKERFSLNRSRRSEATEFFEVDDLSELVEAIEETRRYDRDVFARVSEVKVLEQAESDERVLPVTADVGETFQRLLEARHAEARAKRERQRYEIQLKLTMGTAGDLGGLATWKSELWHRLDGPALKAEEPRIYARFEVEKRRRPFRPL